MREVARRTLLVLVVVVAAPIVTVTMIIVHEIGHTVTARILGDPRATFVLVRTSSRDSCIGCNLYDSARLSLWDNVWVSLAGVLATALITVVTAPLLGSRHRPRWCGRWLLAEIVIVFTVGDAVWQLVQALGQLPIPAREPRGYGYGYTDYSAAVSFATQASGRGHAFWAVLGLVVLGCYLTGVTLLAVRAWRKSLPRTVVSRRTVPAASGVERR